MLPSRGAVANRIGRGRSLSGRASFVWLHGVLVPIACGLAPDGVEIKARDLGKWHLITGTPDEAWSLIRQHYPMQKGLQRKVAWHRERNGLGLDPECA